MTCSCSGLRRPIVARRGTRHNPAGGIPPPSGSCVGTVVGRKNHCGSRSLRGTAGCGALLYALRDGQAGPRRPACVRALYAALERPGAITFRRGSADVHRHVVVRTTELPIIAYSLKLRSAARARARTYAGRRGSLESQLMVEIRSGGRRRQGEPPSRIFP
jgi:hypothetical protein